MTPGAGAAPFRSRSVRARTADPGPWWLLALVIGGLFGLFQVVDNRFREGDSWTEGLVVGLLGGVFFGAVMGPVLARMNRRYREAAGDENVDRLIGIGWRGWRAKVGDDPGLREAARRVTLLQRDQLLRQRRWAILFFVLAIALDVWLAVRQSPWWLVAGVVPAAILGGNLVMPRWLERRADELAGPSSGDRSE